jgi:hypothetical protein
MDIISAWFSDETQDSIVVHIGLSELPNPPAPETPEQWRYSMTWRYADADISVTATILEDREVFLAQVVPHGAGPFREAAIPGRVTPGTPGFVSFLAPKMHLGSPAPGKLLEATKALSYLRSDSGPLDGTFVQDLEGLEWRLEDEAEGSDFIIGAGQLSGAQQTFLFPSWELAAIAAVVIALTGLLPRMRRSRRLETANAVGSERYTFLRELGRGSFGRAVLARDTVLDRHVVLKEPFSGMHDPNERARFLQEARLAARVQHPNVVAIHEILAEREPPAIVLEYVAGGSLEALLSGGRLATQRALQVICEVLDGLGAIHSAGIVHRDVKPDNILLDSNGRAKVTDFGIARPPGDMAMARTLASGSSQPGSLAYMSPEQARGGAIDGRTDLYAAAAVLYRCLTGRHYLDLDSTDPMELRRHIQSVAPTLDDPTIPASLRPVLARAMAKSAIDRFPDARSMAKAIRAAGHVDPPMESTS